MTKVHIEHLLDNLKLTLVAGAKGVKREIVTSDLSRPGIELTGDFNRYAKERLQIIGKRELTYFLELNEEQKQERLRLLFTEVTPGVIVTRGMTVPDMVIDLANRLHIPILHSMDKTTDLMGDLTRFLNREFLPFTSLHGVLMDVSGIGVLITGQSGIGKSEIALELIKLGHRFVADDSVEIHQKNGEQLIGTSPDIIKNLIEIRGLGIINIMSLFGEQSVKDQKEISLIIHLERWDSKNLYDRLGLIEQTKQIMDVHLPTATIPVRPGGSIAVIIEVAVMNYRLKRKGVNTAKEFEDELTNKINERNKE